jgi:dihydrodipicolinate synthase/N-acetylneuraminate lyase
MTYSPRKGLNVPIVTVADEAGSVIESDQRRVIRHVIQNGLGADVIFANGTTGEWNRLRNPERQRVIALSIDEVRNINAERGMVNAELQINPSPFTLHPSPFTEVWAGINGSTRQEILSNLDVALQLRADAAVIAPLAINDLDEQDIVQFFRREMNDLLEASRKFLPVFLYDNADINAPGRPPHIRTHIVKELSRLPWVCGIKVSAPRHVLGNYTRAALHFKQPGEFGIYVGNALLIFEWFRPQRGMIGRLREGWRDWLLSDALPIGVVSGPANVLPREWQKAWRVCWAGDEALMDQYQVLCSDFENLCSFEASGRRTTKMLACFKYALEMNDVISSPHVLPGTPALDDAEKNVFRESYLRWRNEDALRIADLWQSKSQI